MVHQEDWSHPQHTCQLTTDPKYPSMEHWIQQYSGRSRISHRGRQLLRRLRFVKFVCQNERIWTLRGHVLAAPPGSATAIDLTLKGKDVANHLQTQWYIADMLGPAILELPSCVKLGIVELNCAVNLQKRKLVQQKKPTTEGRKVNQDLQHPNSPPLNTKWRPHQGISRWIRRNWPFSRNISHHPMQWYKTHHTCTTEVPDCYVATDVRKTRWVPRTRNHHPSGGAHRLGILTCILLEGKWQADSLFGPQRHQQSHQKRPLQDPHCWGDHTSTGRKQEVYQARWNLIIFLHSPWLQIIPSHHIQHMVGKIQVCMPSLSCAQDIFQRMMHQILEWCKGVIGITDDVVIYGDDDEDHDQNLHNFMHRAHEHGLVFNGEKFEVKKD